MEVEGANAWGAGVGAVFLGLSVSLAWEGAGGVALARKAHVVYAKRVPG